MLKIVSYIVFVLASTWMLLIPTNLQDRWRGAATVEKLKLTHLAINRYFSEFGRLPESIGEIRSYIHSLGISYHPYDAYGLRLSYLPLSRDEYYVKSFGKDEISNSFQGERDLSIVEIKALKRIPASQEALGSRLMQIFPAPLLLGNRPAGRPYFAQLILDTETYARRIIIRGIQDSNFIIPSAHDGVQEFLWLDDKKTIIFTASGSERYDDGIYIWDITTGQSKNILPEIQKNFFPKTGKFYFALSRVDKETKEAYAFVQPMTKSYLNPDEFYRLSRLIKINYGHEDIRVAKYNAPNSIFEFRIHPQDGVKVAPLALEPQKEWSQLGTKGDMEDTIVKWQNYCSKYSETALQPYCLWWLTTLYCDAGKNLEKDFTRKAAIMRSYALETARFLDDQVLAPEYLRAMGNYLLLTLEDEQFPKYAISDFAKITVE